MSMSVAARIYNESLKLTDWGGYRNVSLAPQNSPLAAENAGNGRISKQKVQANYIEIGKYDIQSENESEIANCRRHVVNVRKAIVNYRDDISSCMPDASKDAETKRQIVALITQAISEIDKLQKRLTVNKERILAEASPENAISISLEPKNSQELFWRIEGKRVEISRQIAQVGQITQYFLRIVKCFQQLEARESDGKSVPETKTRVTNNGCPRINPSPLVLLSGRFGGSAMHPATLEAYLQAHQGNQSSNDCVIL